MARQQMAAPEEKAQQMVEPEAPAKKAAAKKGKMYMPKVYMTLHAHKHLEKGVAVELSDEDFAQLQKGWGDKLDQILVLDK